MLTIALIQSQMSAEPDLNLHRACELIEDAAARGAHLVCLPELFRTLYFPQTEDARHFDLAEPMDGASVTTMRERARRLRLGIIVPFFEKRAAGVYHNSLVVINANGERVSHYRKMHIPDDPHFYEKYYFAPGDCGFRIAECGLTKADDVPIRNPQSAVRIGTLICWDQWYPEAARLTALAGAQIIFYPTAIGWHQSETFEVREEQRAAWITMHRAHAIANGVFVAAANRIGVEDELTFWGSSIVINPAGQVIATASRDREEVLVIDLDLTQIETQRRGWPFLRDRRVDAYEGLTKRMLD